MRSQSLFTECERHGTGPPVWELTYLRSEIRCNNCCKIDHECSPDPPGTQEALSVFRLLTPTSIEQMERNVDKQVAAPAETRKPNLPRAKRNRSLRVRMEGWRQYWRLGGRENLVQRKNNGTYSGEFGVCHPSTTITDPTGAVFATIHSTRNVNRY
jgi:hypothetical protein